MVTIKVNPDSDSAHVNLYTTLKEEPGFCFVVLRVETRFLHMLGQNPSLKMSGVNLQSQSK